MNDQELIEDGTVLEDKKLEPTVTSEMVEADGSEADILADIDDLEFDPEVDEQLIADAIAAEQAAALENQAMFPNEAAGTVDEARELLELGLSVTRESWGEGVILMPYNSSLVKNQHDAFRVVPGERMLPYDFEAEDLTATDWVAVEGA